MANLGIYTVGGTVQARGGLYLQRRADGELQQLCRKGGFAYVLTARQMGKSSLMLETANRLSDEGICSAIVDLQKLGTLLEAEQWYLGFLTEMARRLRLQLDLLSWWQAHQHLGVTQRLTLFFEEVVLGQITEQIVIFVDEIDTTLSLAFTDDFFIAIRYFYDARAQNQAFERLTFVLIGVATPRDLIRDTKRTPFNIGQQVDLTDFILAEAMPLAAGLELPEAEAQQALGWVMQWTGGHPYLTQRLCQEMARLGGETWTEAKVDRLVRDTFLGRQGQQDSNLQFVRDMLTKRAPEPVLPTYSQIWRGDPIVLDEEQSLVKSHLKLAGVVKREDRVLRTRNPIYRLVFDQVWVEQEWAKLRPYGELLKAWVESKQLDESRLLRGQALQDALTWAANKSLSHQDYQFLAASQEFDLRETQRTLELKRQTLEAEQAQKALEAEREANRILTEAQDKAELALEQERRANQRIKRRIRIGSTVLLGTLLLSTIVTMQTIQSRNAAQQEAKIASYNVLQSEERVKEAQEKLQTVDAETKRKIQTIEALVTQQIQVAKQRVETAETRVVQAKQVLQAARAERNRAEQGIQVAEQNLEQAERRIQLAEQDLASVKVEFARICEENQNLSQLSELARELYQAGHRNAAELTWKQVGVSYDIQNRSLRTAIVLSNLSEAYQKLDRLPEANRAVTASLKLLEEAENAELIERSLVLAYALGTKASLLKMQGNEQVALSTYTKAFDILESLQRQLSDASPSSSSSLQTSLTDSMAFMYHEFAELLLGSKLTALKQRNLERAHQVIESLQFSLLTNSVKVITPGALRQIHQFDPTAAVIYPFISEDRIDIIVGLPNQPLRHRAIPVSQTQIDALLAKFRQQLREPYTIHTLLTPAQQLYQFIIQPIENELLESQTLVFVLDGSLGSVPMAALHDGEQYLIEKFAVATIPSLGLIEPQTVTQSSSSALIAGISTGSVYQVPLPQVEEELDKIHSILGGKVLFNEHFTMKNLQEEIQTNTFSVVHIASYAQFDSSAEEAFLLASDGRLNGKNLISILQSGSQNIDLLVFSACETAAGNNRSLFGLAELAIQAGVRSTIGSLAMSDDQATTNLIVEFYRRFNDGNSKAQALRYAQLMLMHQPQYQHPRYWSNFFLLGDWR